MLSIWYPAKTPFDIAAAKIHTTAVESSQIAEIGHDGSTLAVKFKGGGVYHYPDVTAEQFEAFQKAGSHGKHFGQHFRSRKNFVKVS